MSPNGIPGGWDDLEPIHDGAHLEPLLDGDDLELSAAVGIQLGSTFELLKLIKRQDIFFRSSIRALVNAAEMDKSKAPSLLSRSLACLRLELQASRCATSSKLRKEWSNRSETNSRAADILHGNQHLWKHVGGPNPDTLFSPTEFEIRQAKRAADMLQRMLDEQPNYKDGFDSFAQECIRAVASLKLLEWDAIRRERFSFAPEGLFSELVNNAETLLTRQADEAERRQEWLAADQEEVDGDDEIGRAHV